MPTMDNTEEYMGMCEYCKCSLTPADWSNLCEVCAVSYQDNDEYEMYLEYMSKYRPVTHLEVA